MPGAGSDARPLFSPNRGNSHPPVGMIVLQHGATHMGSAPKRNNQQTQHRKHALAICVSYVSLLTLRFCDAVGSAFSTRVPDVGQFWPRIELVRIGLQRSVIVLSLRECVPRRWSVVEAM